MEDIMSERALADISNEVAAAAREKHRVRGTNEHGRSKHRVAIAANKNK
ncbi:hypothetical protein [Methylopila sp. M107]|nr:hypothetical protein [Methylopila sp. M107]